MLNLKRLDKDTLDLLVELSKSDREYCVPLIDVKGSIIAHDVIEGTSKSVCSIHPSMIENMVAQFHNHPGHDKVIISDQDMFISFQFNIPLIIGAKTELKIFEQKPKNTFIKDYQNLKEIQKKVIPLLEKKLNITKDQETNFTNAYHKALSNFNVVYIPFDK